MSKIPSPPWHCWHEKNYSVIGVAVHGQTGFKEIATVYENPETANRMTAPPELLEELKIIANADIRKWEEGFQTPEEFMKWAQNRARHAITKAEGK